MVCLYIAPDLVSTLLLKALPVLWLDSSRTPPPGRCTHIKVHTLVNCWEVAEGFLSDKMSYAVPGMDPSIKHGASANGTITE